MSFSPDSLKVVELEKLLKEFYSGIKPQFIEGDFEPMEQKFLDKMIVDPLNLDEHNFHKNDLSLLDIDDGYPKAYRDCDGKIVAIQLRECKLNKILIGCGNNPTSICYHCPSSLDYNKECISFGVLNGGEWWSNTIISQHEQDLADGITHLHSEYITIDCNITMNPTIIGFFGWYKLPIELLPDNSIEEICFEGIRLAQTRYFKHDYERLTGKPLTYIRDIAFE